MPSRSPIGSRQLRDHAPAGLAPDRLIAPLEALAEDLLLDEEAAPHSRPLGALAGEYEDDGRRRLAVPPGDHGRMRSPREVLGQRFPETVCRAADDGQPVLVVRAPYRRRVDEVLESLGARQRLGIRPREGGERRLAPGRERQEGGVSGRGRRRVGDGRRRLQHHVRVRARPAERAHARTATTTPGRPRAECRGDGERSRHRDVRVQMAKVQVRRHRSVLQRQHRLDEAGDPGRAFQVADVRLDRADEARRTAAGAEHRAERLDLDRIAERRPGAVRLHVADAPRARRRPARARGGSAPPASARSARSARSCGRPG